MNDMDASRRKAIEFLKEKGITSPETIVAELDDVAFDKIDSLVDGDCKLTEGNFFEYHLNSSPILFLHGSIQLFLIKSEKLIVKKTGWLSIYFGHNLVQNSKPGSW